MNWPDGMPEWWWSGLDAFGECVFEPYRDEQGRPRLRDLAKPQVIAPDPVRDPVRRKLKRLLDRAVVAAQDVHDQASYRAWRTDHADPFGAECYASCSVLGRCLGDESYAWTDAYQLLVDTVCGDRWTFIDVEPEPTSEQLELPLGKEPSP